MQTPKGQVRLPERRDREVIKTQQALTGIEEVETESYMESSIFENCC